MANWEYKVISSGKGGFASPALMEKFINDLGQEQWEIISFHTMPDNLLAFTGLARRPVMRDWTLEDAAAAAARVEADKLRAEFEAKFKAATSGTAAGADEKGEEKGADFLEEKAGGDDGFRRPVDTSRDDDPDAPEDEWDKLAAEDELPTFFDAIKPHMRRNQRGPGMSVGVDYLAKKWKLEEADIKAALAECGMQIPGDENARPVYVEYDGDLYWVNINRRGEVWINTREKPTPVFRVVPGRRLADEEQAAAEAVTGPAPAAERPAAPPPREAEPRPAPARPASGGEPAASAPKTFLGKIRGMMRRNRRGRGWSGSFQYLTKALKLSDAELLEQLTAQGLALRKEGEPAVMVLEGGFEYWLNQNQRGEIWINAEEKAGERDPRPPEPAPAAESSAPAAGETPAPAEPAAASPEAAPAVPVASRRPLPAENTLTAVRLLMQPKKRGEGVTALVADLAASLEKSPEQLMTALADAGLQPPESPKAKPTFAEHGGEIYWLNVNAKGQVWLNAKDAKKSGGRGRKSEESAAGE
ncbi:MAG: hypothetical protein JNG83_04435 [Opitutaceae bacterium]|nr:hypothetical protein [Opitutaceae bacterium]